VPATDLRLRPRKAARQRRAQQTRDRLLAAAARAFAERGYAGGTTNHIAAEAGMSVGSLYRYYPNKDALLAELMRAHVAEGTEAIRRRMTEAALTPGGVRARGLADRLRPFVAAAIDNHRADPDLHRVLFEEAPRPAAVLAELHALEADAVAAAAALLRADPSVQMPDPELSAWFVVATIESLTHRYIGSHDRDHPDLDAFGAELVRMLVAYLSRPG
jgi:AcrR family transcriptional regulator